MNTKPAVIDRREFLRWSSMAAMGTALSGCATNPVTGRRHFMIISKAQEVEMDRQYAPHQFSADFGPSQDTQMNAYVDSVAMDIAAKSHRSDMPYSARVVNAPHINGYVFPAGSIAVTRGIMLAMDTESELAGLLGHEIGHVNHRHAARRQSWGLLTMLGVAGLGAAFEASEDLKDYADLVTIFGSLGAGLLLSSYSRKDEREADATGMDYMVMAGHNPEGMTSLMQTLVEMHDREPSRLELMFSTHPMSRRRRDDMQKRIDAKYTGEDDRPDGRERYMDNIAELRAIEGAIVHMQAGQSAIWREQYGEALNELQAALRIAEDDYAALLMCVNCLTATNRLSEARRYAARAREIYPEEAQAYFATGVVALREGRYAEANSNFTVYQEKLPGNPNTLLFKGISLEGLGRRNEAAEAYNAYLQISPQGDAAVYVREKLQEWK